MPVVHVEMFKGRTREQKRELCKALTESYIKVMGGKPEGVTIILVDVDKENWAIAGGLVADRPS